MGAYPVSLCVLCAGTPCLRLRHHKKQERSSNKFEGLAIAVVVIVIVVVIEMGGRLYTHLEKVTISPSVPLLSIHTFIRSLALCLATATCENTVTQFFKLHFQLHFLAPIERGLGVRAVRCVASGGPKLRLIVGSSIDRLIR